MIKELGILYRLIKVMNDAGLALLIEAARDITSRQQFRNEEEVDKLLDFDAQVNQVLEMVNAR